MAPQLLAAHNAAMECYRRAMIVNRSVSPPAMRRTLGRSTRFEASSQQSPMRSAVAGTAGMGTCQCRAHQDRTPSLSEGTSAPCLFRVFTYCSHMHDAEKRALLDTACRERRRDSSCGIREGSGTHGPRTDRNLRRRPERLDGSGLRRWDGTNRCGGIDRLGLSKEKSLWRLNVGHSASTSRGRCLRVLWATSRCTRVAWRNGVSASLV